MNEKDLIERLVRLSGMMVETVNALAKLTVDLEDMHKRIEQLEGRQYGNR